MKEDEMGGTCGMHGRDEISILYFGCQTWRKSLLRRHRFRWEDNFTINLHE